MKLIMTSAEKVKLYNSVQDIVKRADNREPLTPELIAPFVSMFVSADLEINEDE